MGSEQLRQDSFEKKNVLQFRFGYAILYTTSGCMFLQRQRQSIFKVSDFNTSWNDNNKSSSESVCSSSPSDVQTNHCDRDHARWWEKSLVTGELNSAPGTNYATAIRQDMAYQKVAATFGISSQCWRRISSTNSIDLQHRERERLEHEKFLVPSRVSSWQMIFAIISMFRFRFMFLMRCFG